MQEGPRLEKERKIETGGGARPLDSSQNSDERLPELHLETQGESAIIESTAERTRIEAVLEKRATSGGIIARLADTRQVTRAMATGLLALNLNLAEVFAEERRPERTYSTEEMLTIEKVTGMPFLKLTDKFEVDIQAQSGPEGKYIIHIGQKHEHPGFALWKSMTQETVVETQKKIEELESHVIDANNLTCIYEEGFADDKAAPSFRDYVHKATPQLDAVLSKPITTFEELSAAADILKKLSNNMEHKVIFHYLGEKVATLRENILSALNEGAGVPRTEEEEFLKKIIEGEVLISFMSTIFKMGEKSDPYTMGATTKLFMEGKLEKICPTEDPQLNKQAMGVMEEMDQAELSFSEKRREIWKEIKSKPEIARAFARREELMEKEKVGLTKDEAEENEGLILVLRAALDGAESDPRLTEEKARLDSVKAKWDQLAYTAREIEVLRKINAYDSLDIANGNALGNVVVVYGDAHDFTDVVQQWNQESSSNRPIERGLIKISPKD